MIIRTTQELALVAGDCCDCLPPTCAAPKLSCESITINLDCGYELPYHSSVTPEDACKRFAKRTFNQLYKLTQTGNGYAEYGDYTTDYDDHEFDTVTCEWVILSGDCVERFRSSEQLHYTDHYETYPPAAQNYRLEYTSTASFSSEPVGSAVYVDRDDSANNYTDEYTGGLGCGSGTINEDWTFAGNSFSFYNDAYFEEGYEDPTTETHSIQELSITYSDPFDPEYVNTVLDSLNFPADVNGDACIATMVMTPLTACNRVTQATKTRYSVGIPEGYSPLSAMKAVYEVQWDEVFVPSLSTEPPILINERSWIWDGTLENQFSDWFEMEPLSGGEVKIANGLSLCYKSERLGSIPTAWGEIIEID